MSVISHRTERLKGLQRRTELLQVGLKLFARQGYHATSIRKIAHAAGVTEGLIYHYFSSKEDLLKKIVENSIQDNHILELEPPSNLPIRDALLQIGRSYFERLHKNKDIFRLMIAESHLFERARDLFIPKMIYERGMKKMGAFLEKRMMKGELRAVDPILAARQFTGSLVSFFIFQEMLVGKQVVKVSPEDFLEVSIEVFLGGLISHSPRSP
jgi:AcrR family transcriptional regulator